MTVQPVTTGWGRRVTTGAAAIALTAGAVVAGWWAHDVTVAESAPVARSDDGGESMSADVVEATVGRTLNLGVTVRQPRVLVAVNHLLGVVTQVSGGGGDTEQGAVLYEVARVPIVAVRSEVPFYRSLSKGDDGDDVRALQAMLAETGYLEHAPDGDFGTATELAVRAWQDGIGQKPTGKVALGTVVAFPELPVRATLDDSIARGAILTGGEFAVYAPSGHREFLLEIDESQARQVPEGARVRIEFEGRWWKGVVASSKALDESGTVELSLTAPRGGAVCGTDCDALPGDDALSLMGTVEVVKPASGPAVPAAAVRTRADGSAYVLMNDGEQRDVTVKGTGQGLAVLGGVDSGEKVRLSVGGEG